MTISNEPQDELLEGCAMSEDLLGDAGLMKKLIRLVDRMPWAELTRTQGYARQAPPKQPNRRNGTGTRLVYGSEGEMPLTVPRDLDGSLGPELVKNGRTRIDGIDDKIVVLYATGIFGSTPPICRRATRRP